MNFGDLVFYVPLLALSLLGVNHALLVFGRDKSLAARWFQLVMAGVVIFITVQYARIGLAPHWMSAAAFLFGCAAFGVTSHGEIRKLKYHGLPEPVGTVYHTVMVALLYVSAVLLAILCSRLFFTH